MKHRLILPALARVEERDKQWYIVARLGMQEFSFLCGPKDPGLTAPEISLILEYQVADADSSSTPVV